MINSS